MKKHKTTFILLFLSLFVVGSMLAAVWPREPEVGPLKWGVSPSRGDTMSIMTRNTGADSIKLDTAWINLKSPAGSQKAFEAIEEIGFLIKFARCWDSTKTTKATCSLTVRIEGEDYLGNLHSLIAVIAYDSTKLYVARDSLRDGYWWSLAINDTMLDRFTVQWDSLGGRSDTLTGQTTTHMMQVLGQGWQTRFKRLAIIQKTVFFDSTAFIDTTTLIGHVIWK